MAIFTMSDLHLSLGTDKPMEVFGPMWDDYVNRIRDGWNSVVCQDDTVIIGGDVSWGMTLTECTNDFRFLNSLSGYKLVFKGNHDYWWDSMTKLNRFLADNNLDSISFMQNNAYLCEDTLIAGSRNWLLPADFGSRADDFKIYNRELMRLELSLKDGERLCKENNVVPKRTICVLHYPPYAKDHSFDKELVSLMQSYNVTECIYGHLHAQTTRSAIEGNIDGINYRLVSADHLGFTPVEV